MPEHSIRSPVRSARYVILCVHRKGIPLIEIHPSTDMVYDTRIDGDDAEELLLDIDRLKRVDWTGFHFRDYYTDEALLIFKIMYYFLIWLLTPVRVLFRYFFRKAGWFQNSSDEKKLTVADLIGTHYHLSWQNRNLDPDLYKNNLEEWKEKFAARFASRFKKRK